MVCLDTRAEIHIPRGGVIRLDDAAGTAVRCLAGAVWITLERDGRDILLEPGGGFVIDRGGLSLVCAVAGPAAVAVGGPARNAGTGPSEPRRAAGAPRPTRRRVA